MNKRSTAVKNQKLSLTLKNWLTIIGSFIIFSSWMAERQIDLHKSKVDDLKRSQLVIDITEVNRSGLEMEYNKLIRTKVVDSLQLASVEINLSLIYMNLINYNRARNAGDDSAKLKQAHTDILQKNYIDSLNRKAFQKGRFAFIDSSFLQVQNIFGQKYMLLDSQFPTVYRIEDSSQQFWSNIFSWSYTVGSIFIAIAYLSGLWQKVEN